MTSCQGCQVLEAHLAFIRLCLELYCMPPPSQYRVVERIPFTNQTNVQPTAMKRPASRDANP